MTDQATKEIIASMLVENTGTHFLDSGGTSGRMWQRNQMAVALSGTDAVNYFESRPPVFWDGWSVTLDLYHYLTGEDTSSGYTRLLYRPDITERFRRWVGLFWLEDGSRDRYYNAIGTVEEWMDRCKEHKWIADHPEFPGGRYTYNEENSLSQDFQHIKFAADFPHMDEPIEIIGISIHNGADARGGFTDWYFFEGDGWDFGFDLDQFSAHCDMCEQHPAPPDTTLFDTSAYVKERWGWYRYDYGNGWSDEDGYSSAVPHMDCDDLPELPDDFEQRGPICGIHLCNMEVSL